MGPIGDNSSSLFELVWVTSSERMYVLGWKDAPAKERITEPNEFRKTFGFPG